MMNEIRLIRKQLGWSQERLARDLGVSLASVQSWEKEEDVSCLSREAKLIWAEWKRKNEELFKAAMDYLKLPKVTENAE